MEETPPFVKGSDTSREAAKSMTSAAAALREKVFRLIKSQGEKGFTCDEVEVKLGGAVRQSTVSARVRELVLKSRLVDSRARRLTRSHRKAVVWIAVDGESKQSPLKLKRVRADRLFVEIEGLPRVVRKELIQDILDNWCSECGAPISSGEARLDPEPVRSRGHCSSCGAAT